MHGVPVGVCNNIGRVSMSMTIAGGVMCGTRVHGAMDAPHSTTVYSVYAMHPVQTVTVCFWHVDGAIVVGAMESSLMAVGVVHVTMVARPMMGVMVTTVCGVCVVVATSVDIPMVTVALDVTMVATNTSVIMAVAVSVLTVGPVSKGNQVYVAEHLPEMDKMRNEIKK